MRVREEEEREDTEIGLGHRVRSLKQTSCNFMVLVCSMVLKYSFMSQDHPLKDGGFC